ncbi:MAG: CoA-binding protein [Saprospiraceae bacterium]|jgi:predicted CoA-binding protein|nr:CoA-binding protein [Saprospiraceae bacterium]
MKDTTLVLGASENPARYSNLAIKSLLKNGFKVKAVGNRRGNVEGVEINSQPIHFEDIDTITLYLGPKNQEQYYDYILRLNPNRIIFNPGTENCVLKDLANSNGIITEYACTLVMLSLKQF